MGFWTRLKLIFRAKTHAALVRAEDPRQMLEYADDQHYEMLRRLKQGIIEVAISKRQLQQHVNTLQARIPKLDEQAAAAVAANRDDLARLALERKEAAVAELEGLESQVAEVEREEHRLINAEQKLTSKIDQFKLQRETLLARYSAAEAQVQVKEALTGVTGEFAALGVAVGRAEERIDRMISRANAVDDLIDLEDVNGPSGFSVDVVERELKQIGMQERIDRRLQALKAGESPAAPRD